MGVKIQLGMDNKDAMASLDVLEARLRKISAAAADIFKAVSPTSKIDLLKQYGIPLQADIGGHILQSERYMAQAARMVSKMGTAIPQTVLDPKLLAQGAKQLTSMGKLPIPGMGIFPGTYDPSQLRSAARILSPVTPGSPQWISKLKGTLDNPINWQMAGIGGLSALFSPWIGARLVNQSGILRSMNQNAGGGMMKAIFGGNALGFGELFVFISALKTAARVITHEFVQSIQRGSKLYLQSAELGTAPERLSQLQKTFSLLGLSPDMANRMMASGQFRPGFKMSPQQMQGVLLGAAGSGTGSREEMQAIMNMSRVVAAAWNQTLSAARQSAGSATNLFRTRFLFSQLSEEWKTFWEQLSSVLSGALNIIEMSAIGFLHAMNAILELFQKIPDLLYLIPGIGPLLTAAQQLAERMLPLDDPNKFKRFGLGVPVSRPESMWERMGLVSHGGIGSQMTNYARQTAENTKEMVKLLSFRVGSGAAASVGTGSFTGGAVGALGTIPNLP